MGCIFCCNTGRDRTVDTFCVMCQGTKNFKPNLLPVTVGDPDKKGKKGEVCNSRACGSTDEVLFYRIGSIRCWESRKYYCKHCAWKINSAQPERICERDNDG